MLGMPALAVTDHGVLWGCADLFFECQKLLEMSDKEFKKANAERKKDGKLPLVSRPKPIMGYEAYYSSGMRYPGKDISSKTNYHLVLLAKTLEGWRNLSKLFYQGYKDGFYRKPRVDKELLKAHSAGLVATSACVSGFPQRELLKLRATKDDIHRQNAIAHIHTMLEIFNGDYYLEVQDTKIKSMIIEGQIVEKPQRWVASQLKDLSLKTGAKIVLTNDFHFLDAEDKEAQAGCRRISSRNQDDDMYDQNWMKTQAEMAKLFSKNPEWMEETVKVAEMCSDVDIRHSEHLMPAFDASPYNISTLGLFDDLLEEGFEYRYPEGHALRGAAKDRLAHEVKVIKKLNFPDYFLIIWDICRYAREQDIAVGLGRGSAAGSIVSYLLNITQLCPLKYNLLFERFLHEGRIAPPDVDMDFDASRRDELIRYTEQKYGLENVAHIVTFQTMQSKAVVREMGRVYGLDIPKVESIVRNIPVKFGKPTPLKEAFKEDALRHMLCDREIERMYTQGLKIEGNPRSQGIHPAGIIVCPEPVGNVIPTFWDRKKEITLTAFDDTTCEKFGLMKLDFLGLRSLTVYDNCKRDIKKTLDVEIVDDDIPLDDARTFQVFCQGFTKAIFQMDASGFAHFAKRIQPDHIGDLIAMVAIYRPGPLGTVDVSYIKRRAGEERVSYWPGCEEILSSTYGLLVYQEQAMQISRKLCGFTASEADTLRKAIGKKLKKLMDEQKEKFLEGAEKTGIVDRPTAEQIFMAIEAFANYGFNLSHAASYGVFSYRTAWLKANYPLFFLKAVLNDKMGEVDRIAQVVQEAKQMGIRILPPDINRSQAGFEIDGNSLVYGLSAVKGVGAAGAVIAKKRKSKPFANLRDFCNRMPSRVKRNNIEALIKAGAFRMYKSRSEPLIILGKCMDMGKKYQTDVIPGTFQEFAIGDTDPVLPPSDKTDPQLLNLTPAEELQMEREALGFFLSDSPLKYCELAIRTLASQDRIEHLSDIEDMPNREAIFVCIIANITARMSRARRPFWRATLQDELSADCIIFESCSQQMEEIRDGDTVVVLGRPDNKNDQSERSIVVSDIHQVERSEDIEVAVRDLERRREDIADTRRRRDRGKND